MKKLLILLFISSLPACIDCDYATKKCMEFCSYYKTQLFQLSCEGSRGNCLCIDGRRLEITTGRRYPDFSQRGESCPVR